MRCTICAIVLSLSFLTIPARAKPPVKDEGYPFQVPAAKAFAVLAKLDRVAGQSLAPSADELKLFADAADGKFDAHSFGEACLIASGVTDPAKRHEYMKKLDAIEADARQALEG